MTQAVLPRVLGIGAQKAGTSWLHENLKQNKHLWLPPIKELHFFDHKFVPANQKWTDWHLARALKQARETWERRGILDQRRLDWLNNVSKKPNFNGNWYKKIFELCPNDRISIDITPEYSSVPKDGIKFIRHFLGEDFKAIYIIRDPVERAISQLRMNLDRRKAIPDNKEEWMKLISEDSITERGNYISHVQRWQSERSEETLLFIPFGLIKSSPLSVMRQIEDFIGVPHANYNCLDRKVFESKNINIPNYVRDAFTERLYNQDEFIKNIFGAEFYSNCK